MSGLGQSFVCPVCGGEGQIMGRLGNREHCRCIQCGMEFSHEVPRTGKRPKKQVRKSSCPDVCPECGGQFKDIAYGAECDNCGLIWNYCTGRLEYMDGMSQDEPGGRCMCSCQCGNPATTRNDRNEPVCEYCAQGHGSDVKIDGLGEEIPPMPIKKIKALIEKRQYFSSVKTKPRLTEKELEAIEWYRQKMLNEYTAIPEEKRKDAHKYGREFLEYINNLYNEWHKAARATELHGLGKEYQYKDPKGKTMSGTGTKQRDSRLWRIVWEGLGKDPSPYTTKQILDFIKKSNKEFAKYGEKMIKIAFTMDGKEIIDLNVSRGTEGHILAELIEDSMHGLGMGEYNGWANRATWNVALWIGNDEPLYRAAVEFMRSYKGRAPYGAFIKQMGLEHDRTPDGTKWYSNVLNYKELNDMMKELAG